MRAYAALKIVLCFSASSKLIFHVADTRAREQKCIFYSPKMQNIFLCSQTRRNGNRLMSRIESVLVNGSAAATALGGGTATAAGDLHFADRARSGNCSLCAMPSTLYAALLVSALAEACVYHIHS